MKQDTWIECTTNSDKAEFLGLDYTLNAHYTTILSNGLVIQTIPTLGKAKLHWFLNGYYRATELAAIRTIISNDTLKELSEFMLNVGDFTKAEDTLYEKLGNAIS